MKHEGRGVIRIGDKTSHGGTVLSASSGTVVMGKLAALEGDMTVCPRCKGKYALKPDGAGAKHEGKPYTYHNDLTECGARLISSLAFNSGSGSGEDGPRNESETNVDLTGTISTSSNAFDFDMVFEVKDHNDYPLSDWPYQIELQDGTKIVGRTDQCGLTQRVAARYAAEATLTVFAPETSSINPDWDR